MPKKFNKKKPQDLGDSSPDVSPLKKKIRPNLSSDDDDEELLFVFDDDEDEDEALAFCDELKLKVHISLVKRLIIVM